MGSEKIMQHTVNTPANAVERIMRRCKHFNGVMNDRCEAGVAYADVTINGTFQYRSGGSPQVYTLGKMRPCMRDQAEFYGVPACPKAVFPTHEEAAAENIVIRKGFDDIMTARKAIVAHIDKTNEQGGSIDCPICKAGKLRYSRARSNGHIHAGCTTKNCVGWME